VCSHRRTIQIRASHMVAMATGRREGITSLNWLGGMHLADAPTKKRQVVDPEVERFTIQTDHEVDGGPRDMRSACDQRQEGA